MDGDKFSKAIFDRVIEDLELEFKSVASGALLSMLFRHLRYSPLSKKYTVYFKDIVKVLKENIRTSDMVSDEVKFFYLVGNTIDLEVPIVIVDIVEAINREDMGFKVECNTQQFIETFTFILDDNVYQEFLDSK